MAAMERAGIKKVIVKEKTGYELHLERHDEVSQAQHPAPVAYPVYHSHPVHHHREEHAPHKFPASPSSVEGGTSAKEEGKFVNSPMVGTFYAAASPDDPAFIKVGDRVEENTVVCIIEAMKVMNEVKAGVSGVVAEILVQNAHPVEFGTKMFRIV